MRSATRRVMEIVRASRGRGKGVEEKRKRSYQQLLSITGQVVRQAERMSQAVTAIWLNARTADHSRWRSPRAS